MNCQNQTVTVSKITTNESERYTWPQNTGNGKQAEIYEENGGRKMLVQLPRQSQVFALPFAISTPAVDRGFQILYF